MKKFRVFCTDPDATDSSSSDEDDEIPENPTKKKRFLREVTICTGDALPENPVTPVPPPPETPEKVVKKYPGVRQRPSGKYVAEIRHPISKVKLWLGTFNTAKEAYDVYCLKKLELESLRSLKSSSNCVDLNPNDVVIKDDDDDKFSEGLMGENSEKEGKLCEKEADVFMEVPEGVKKVNSGKWGAMIDHPETKMKIWLGSFESVEEAVRVYREKESEFKDVFGVGKKRRLSEIYSEENVCGVGDGKCGNNVDSCVEPLEDQELEKVSPKKKIKVERIDQFEKIECGFGGKADVGSKDGFGYQSKDVIIALAVPTLSKEDESKKRNTKNSSVKVKGSEQCSDSIGKAMSGEKYDVRKTKLGRYGVWITHPISGNDYCLRSYETIEEALECIQKRMAQLEKPFESKKRDGPCDVVPGTPKKGVFEVKCGSPTSVLDVRNEDRVTCNVKVKSEVEYGPVHDLPTLAVKNEGVRTEDVNVYQSKGIEDACSKDQQNLNVPFTFDDAIRMGIMNEYGQLLGDYCECDESMWLSNHDEDEAAAT